MDVRPRSGGPSARRAAVVVAVTTCLLVACATGCDGGKRNPRPNVLWVVWDTVRADRLSLYGHSRATTPKLDRWARGARVFEDCLSVASTTLPSHASMFTGLLPSRHGVSDARRWLDDGHETLAEILREAGYQTYLWSANPYVSAAHNFDQGFEVAEHPWDPARRRRAREIVRKKLAGDRTGERQRVEAARVDIWAIKAAGELALASLRSWLERRDPERPFFAFLNYMEAHQKTIPPRRHRERLMSDRLLDRSYRVDTSWLTLWRFTFGLHDYPPGDLDAIAATYDASLAELDDLFARLLRELGAAGHLDDTVIVLTSDHGEHLGEHHMLDHQYSLYSPLLRVPLVVHYPRRVPPGREPLPVTNFDLFPTLLELTGAREPPPAASGAASLLDPPAPRIRIAEYPAPFAMPLESVRRRHPDWEPVPWQRALRALREGPYELIWGEDGRHELYRLDVDPGERENRIDREPEVAARYEALLRTRLGALAPRTPDRERSPEVSPELREMLRGLGYVEPMEAPPVDAAAPAPDPVR